jgi:hypothetical protein
MLLEFSSKCMRFFLGGGGGVGGGGLSTRCGFHVTKCT